MLLLYSMGERRGPVTDSPERWEPGRYIDRRDSCFPGWGMLANRQIQRHLSGGPGSYKIRLILCMLSVFSAQLYVDAMMNKTRVHPSTAYIVAGGMSLLPKFKGEEPC